MRHGPIPVPIALPAANKTAAAIHLARTGTAGRCAKIATRSAARSALLSYARAAWMPSATLLTLRPLKTFFFFFALPPGFAIFTRSTVALVAASRTTTYALG